MPFTEEQLTAMRDGLTVDSTARRRSVSGEALMAQARPPISQSFG